MRKVLMLGVCVLFALQGVAQASVVEKPCPMQERGHVHATRVAKTSHHCCNDAHTAAKTGKTCKTGQECPISGAYLSSEAPLCSFPSVGFSRVSSPEPFTLRVDPSGRWRPPALS